MILTSCKSMITDVEIPANKTESELVIISYISPDDSLVKVKLYKSAAYFNNAGINEEDYYVKDGTITISDGTITKQFSYNAASKEYICTDNTFKIQAGANYTIETSTPDGKTNRATCTAVSDKVEDFSIEVSDSIINGQYSYGQIEYTIDISIPDIANQENYYRILAYNREDTMNTYPSLDEYKTDERLDGQDIKFRSKLFVSDTTKKMEVFLLTCDKAYYDYHKSVWNNNSGSPFSEPTMVYSNTENGMGVFCSYRWIRKELQLK